MKDAQDVDTIRLFFIENRMFIMIMTSKFFSNFWTLMPHERLLSDCQQSLMHTYCIVICLVNTKVQ